MTLSLNPTIQSLILHMYTIFKDSSLHSSGENCETNLTVKVRKRTKKGMIKARSPILNPIIQQFIVHVYTKVQHPSLKKFLRKLQHKFLMLTCNIGKERKMDKNKKNKSHDLESKSHDTISYSTYVYHI